MKTLLAWLVRTIQDLRTTLLEGMLMTKCVDPKDFSRTVLYSDPDPLLDVSGASGGNVPGLHGKVRRDDITRRSAATAEGQLRPSRAAATEQWARQSRGGGSAGGNLPRRGSDSSGLGTETGKGKKKPNLVLDSNLEHLFYHL